MEQKEKNRILLELPFNNTLPFLLTELKKGKRTFYVRFFFWGCIFLVISGIFLFKHFITAYHPSFWDFLSALLLSFAVLFLIAPFHEMLHGLAFKMKGAQKVQYGILWRSLAAYAVAVDFECSYKQFRFIGLAPLLLITPVLIFPLFLQISVFWKILCYSTLVQHYLSSIGDILLLNYFHQFKDQNVVTWDDIERKISYFIEKQ